MKKLTAILVLALALAGAFALPAFATPASSSATTVELAQECQIGQICEPGQTPGFVEPEIDWSKVKDPPGARLRSLIMLGLLGTAFVVYLRKALDRGSKIG